MIINQDSSYNPKKVRKDGRFNQPTTSCIIMEEAGLTPDYRPPGNNNKSR